MMPKDFKKKNFVYTGYEHPEVGMIRDLPVYQAGDGAIYSIWRPQFWEWLRILCGQPIIVGVISSRQFPMTVQVGEDRIPVGE